jgi:hypothetical protein
MLIGERLNCDIFRASGIFFEDYLRNLTCSRKTKNRIDIRKNKIYLNNIKEKRQKIYYYPDSFVSIIFDACKNSAIRQKGQLKLKIVNDI